MKPRKRIRPLMGSGDILSIPRILIIPAFLVSCALIPLIWIEGSLPASNLVGAGFAALAFGGLTVFAIIIPFIHGLTLKQSGIEGNALILKKEKRSRWVIASDSGQDFHNDISVVTIEFTPQGGTSPLQLEVEVAKPGKYKEGKTVQIRYAASNPRIMKFKEE